MKNKTMTAGKTATESVGVTETQKDKYRKAWESHLNDFNRLLWNLPKEQQESFEEWKAEGRRLIAFATTTVEEEQHENLSN